MKLVTHSNNRLILQDGPNFSLFALITVLGAACALPGIYELLNIEQPQCAFDISVSSICIRPTVWPWALVWYPTLLAILAIAGGACIGGGALWAIAYTATSATFNKKQHLVVVRHPLPYSVMRHSLNEVKEVVLEETWEDSDVVLYRICLTLVDKEPLPLTGFHPHEQEVEEIAHHVRMFLAH